MRKLLLATFGIGIFFSSYIGQKYPATSFDTAYISTLDREIEKELEAFVKNRDRW
ncbi:MAG TPA: hypothetical protein VJK48_00080 [Chlamydiales bacterium]|nr:hypothetical protein [Chlamydiales bacterium]